MAKLCRLCWLSAAIIILFFCGSYVTAKEFATKNTGYRISYKQLKFKKKDCNRHIINQAFEEEAYFSDDYTINIEFWEEEGYSKEKRKEKP